MIVALNHSGTLPFDALMTWADIVRRSEPTRVPRVVMDHFVPQLPFVGTVFTRGGGTGGSRGNLHALLEDGALVMVCPEGTRGIGKRFSERYTLQRWTPGHAEFAGADTLPLSRLIERVERVDVPLPGPVLGPLYVARALTRGTDFRYDLNRWRFHFSALPDGAHARAALGYEPVHPIDWAVPRL